ncbi:MFS transporter [Loigolactobacillus binensis]|uniref:MFS transporter n=1 Tax=Loigolactobacillus binensis TaxID=2559922 RepID=A0ABW3EFZ0_9LACO|nr:MFS transporter [Loigolactobacillus binensis]
MSEKIAAKTIGAVVATGLMSFSGVIVETAMNITFPTLMREFHVSTTTVQWMTTLYLLVVASIVPLSATLKRRFKTKSLFLFAITMFILGVILDGLAPQFWVLLLGRAVQGMGTGVALPLMFNIILEQVPQSRIGMMMGFGTLITGIAPAIGPTFGGLVVSTMSWRFIFAFLLPILIIALILGLTCITQTGEQVIAPVDLGSVVLIIIAFCGLIWGIANLGSVASIIALVIGLVALVGFSVRSLRQDNPIIQLHLFANRYFTGHVLSFIFLQITALGLSFVLPNYMQLVNGRSALIAGLMVLPGAALGGILAPISGRLYDHFGAKRILLSGSIVVAIGLLGLTIFGRRLTPIAISGWYLIYMLGIGTIMGNMMTNGLRQIKQDQAADGNAIFTTMQQFAAALGTSLAAMIVAVGQRSTASQAVGTAIGAANAFLLLLGLTILELVIMLVVLRKAK